MTLLSVAYLEYHSFRLLSAAFSAFLLSLSAAKSADTSENMPQTEDRLAE